MGEVEEFTRVKSFEGVGSFVPVRTAALRVGTVTDFDIFLPPRPGQPPVLYRQASLPFTEHVRMRLLSNRITELYVRLDQRKAFRSYTESNMPAILRDPGIPEEEKAEIIYETTRDLLREILANPESSNLVRRGTDIVAATVDHMVHEPSAFEHLLRVTSFDYYTYTHSVNAFIFATVLAQRSGCSDMEMLRGFGTAVLLHDVGKSRIDPGIVRKRGPLSDEEWVLMRRHPLYGEEILRKHDGLPSDLYDIVRHHHEKLTGRGYPDQLPADKLSAFVRISTIVDIFDALTTRRPYKGALQSFPALKLMKEEMEDELDQDLFRMFVEMMHQPSG